MTLPSTRHYAGIGSRETPAEVLQEMQRLGANLARKGFVLRSGAAPGADSAFERGCDSAGGDKQIFLPWPGFADRPIEPGRVFAGVGPNALALAELHHPNWTACSRAARNLHARNGYQVLGRKLDDPVAFVICWTKDGKGGGGTGQALRIATANHIPIIDLGGAHGIEQIRDIPLFRA